MKRSVEQNVVLVLYPLFQSCSFKEKQQNPHLFKYSVQLVVQALDEDIGRNNSIISNLMSFCNNNSRHAIQTEPNSLTFDFLATVQFDSLFASCFKIPCTFDQPFRQFLLLNSIEFHCTDYTAIEQLLTRIEIGSLNQTYQSNRIYLNRRRIPSI